ncbi:cyclin-dependent kinase F-4-like [Cryptomeria japonica]|uniref:cyclin-dependent kinase F-4-like n=1 Tax=Cryptomeria japonica TaxID=3369 RepID=UPI0027D9D9B7|nr:cyclin-dependent kinase F-4-like [Cryptomeria japonica]
MDSDLWRVIKNRKQPSLSRTVQRLCFKILKALEYMHGLGYSHHDLKPENLLLEGNNIKISDFGLANNLKEKMEKNEPLDPHVATIAYKVPKLLLKSSCYDFAIDMWSLGVIIAQFHGLEPIFGSRSDWRNQIYNICSVIGCPNEKTWPEGLKLAESLDYQFPKEFDGENCRKNLRRLMSTASEEVIDLVKHLCSWDPKRRPTIKQALSHPFFQSCNNTMNPKFFRYQTNSVLSQNVVFYGFDVFNSEKEERSIQGCVGRISRNSKEKGSARISIEKGSSRSTWQEAGAWCRRSDKMFAEGRLGRWDLQRLRASGRCPRAGGRHRGRASSGGHARRPAGVGTSTTAHAAVGL